MNDYAITVRENIPATAAVVVNNTGILSITDIINYGILLALAVQIAYSIWKFRHEYGVAKDKCKHIDHKED